MNGIDALLLVCFLLSIGLNSYPKRAACGLTLAGFVGIYWLNWYWDGGAELRLMAQSGIEMAVAFALWRVAVTLPKHRDREFFLNMALFHIGAGAAVLAYRLEIIGYPLLFNLAQGIGLSQAIYMLSQSDGFRNFIGRFSNSLPRFALGGGSQE